MDEPIQPVDDDDFARIKEEVEQMSPYELQEHVEELLATPEVQAISEALTPRLFVTFRQALLDLPPDGGHVCEAVFGPYLDAALEDDKITVTTPATEDDLGGETLLATKEDDRWRVHDGLEDASPLYAWVRFITFPPRPPDQP